MRNVTKQLFSRILPVIAFICLVSVFSAQDAKAMDAIGETGVWEGEVDGERYVSYQASVSGYYDVSLESENAANDIRAIIYDDNDEWMSTIYRGATRAAVRLEAGQEYYISLCSEGEDGADNPETKDILTFSISYNELEVLPVTETKQTVSVYEGVNLFEFNPGQDGCYSFECKFIGTEGIYLYGLKLYAVDGEEEELIEERYYNENNASGVRFYLQGGQKYCLECSIEPDEVSSVPTDGVPAGVQLKKVDEITGIEVVEIPDTDYYDYYDYYDSIPATIKLNVIFGDGTKEAVSGTEILEGETSFNGISWKRKDTTSDDVGEHEIEITYLGKYKTTGVLTVFKKTYYELADKTLYDGKIVTITNEYLYDDMYRFIPDSTGVYTFWTYNSQSFDDVWGSYGLLLYDEKDNQAEWIDGMGYKVKAGEKYCLVLYLDNRSEGVSSFRFSFAKNTDHVCTYGEWETVKKPTYQEYGLKRRVCTVCGAVEEDQIDKLSPVTSGPIAMPTAKPTAWPNKPSPTAAPGGSKGTVNKTRVKAPGRVASVKLKKIKKDKIKVSYKKVKGAKGYRIQYATNAKMKKAKSVTTSKAKYTIKKLKSGKTYYVRVCAYKMDGSGKVYGKWSKVKKIKIAASKSAQATVAKNVKLNKSKLSLKVGKSYTLKLNNNTAKVKWSSSDKSIATVTQKGKVTAKKAGTCKITATVAGKKYTCKVTVKGNKIQGYGTVSGNVTYLYNNYVGHVADTNAVVLLISKSGSAKNMPALPTYASWTVPATVNKYNKYGVYAAKVDGTGQYTFNNVAAGEYDIIIISSKTTSGVAFDDRDAYAAVLTNRVSPYISQKNATMLGQFVGYNKYTVDTITLKANQNYRYGYDFGITFV